MSIHAVALRSEVIALVVYFLKLCILPTFFIMAEVVTFCLTPVSDLQFNRVVANHK